MTDWREIVAGALGPSCRCEFICACDTTASAVLEAIAANLEERADRLQAEPEAHGGRARCLAHRPVPALQGAEAMKSRGKGK